MSNKLQSPKIFEYFAERFFAPAEHLPGTVIDPMASPTELECPALSAIHKHTLGIHQAAAQVVVAAFAKWADDRLAQLGVLETRIESRGTTLRLGDNTVVTLAAAIDFQPKNEPGLRITVPTGGSGPVPGSYGFGIFGES